MPTGRQATTSSLGRAKGDVFARAPASPPAARQRRRRWRDPRLWLGVLLVLASVVGGAKVLASADDTVAVWQVVRDVPSGTAVGSSDVRATQVHFDERSVASRYLPADEPLLAGSHATRDLAAGELLAASAVSSVALRQVRQFPLGVAEQDQPADLSPGDHVEVWAVADSTRDASAGRPAAALVLRDVVVLAVGGGGQASLSGERQVLVGLPQALDVGGLLERISGATVVLVRLAS